LLLRNFPDLGQSGPVQFHSLLMVVPWLMLVCY